jgi:hypothetical protein
LPLPTRTPPTAGLLTVRMQAEWDRGEEKKKNNVDLEKQWSTLAF